MATTIKLQCAVCEKNAGIFQCGGCNQAFCNKHSIEHRQTLGAQVENIMHECNLIRQTLNDENDEKMQRLEAEKKIDTWQKEAIEMIIQIADQAREQFKQHVIKRKKHIEDNVQKLAENLKMAQTEENFIETDLREWTNQIDQLKLQISMPIQIAFRDNDDKLIPFVPQSYSYTDTRLVQLIKSRTSLGFCLWGGKEYKSSIYISKIMPGSVAEKQGELKVGDQLLSVNDTSVENTSHQTAVSLIAETKENENVKLVVRYAPDEFNRLQNA